MVGKVVCCRAVALCEGCSHATPHERETRHGDHCTGWGECGWLIEDPEDPCLKVRCTCQAKGER